MASGSGWRSDQRFNLQNFAAKEGRASAAPRQVVATGRSGGMTAASMKAHAESDRRMQYVHKVTCKKAERSRIE